MPDAMWEKIRLLLPDYETCLLGGRPRRDLRSVADAIFYRLRTGCQWKAIPKSLAPGSTAHAYFQEWVQLGVFARLWHIALELYEDLVGARLALAKRRRCDDQSASWWRIDREKPNGSCEIGNKAIVAHRGRSNPNWFSRRRRQRA
jgi:transposase